jgi:hypothetical protein
VLIVGGITKLASLYRKTVEDTGAKLEYHDGYMKSSGSKRLENGLRRADVVLCPVSCNSHAACALVKKLAKKHGKRIHMLPSASLSSIARALA